MKPFIKKLVRKFHIARVMLIRRISKKAAEAHPAQGEEKWAAIDTLRKKRNINVFIETGTYHGDTVEHFKNSFKKIYSIELGKELATAAQKKFATMPHIRIVQGDSTTVLSDILENVHEPALFWLDAHCSEGDTVLGNDYSPILAELRTILTRPENHSVLIDDARLFDGVNYPTFGTLRRLAKSLRPEYTCKVDNDLTYIHPHD